MRPGIGWWDATPVPGEAIGEQSTASAPHSTDTSQSLGLAVTSLTPNRPKRANAPLQLGVGVEVDAASRTSEQANDDARVNVLFLDGAARSGTTMLARMIGAQPQFMTVGEAVRIWHFGVIGNARCSCGRKFSACTFWREVGDSAPGLYDTNAAGRYVKFLDAFVLKSRSLPWLWTATGRRHLERAIPAGFLEDISRLYHAVRTVSGAKVVVDSSKAAAYRFILGLAPDLNMTAVHLIRDPRAVAFSWQRESALSVFDRSDDSLRFEKRGALVAGVDWVLQNYSTEVVNRLVDNASYRLRYEDLVLRPEPTVQEFVRTTTTALALGDGSARRQDPTIELPEVHIFGNPIRFTVGPVPIRLDDEWCRAMSPQSRILTTAIASPLISRYGYRFRAHSS